MRAPKNPYDSNAIRSGPRPSAGPLLDPVRPTPARLPTQGARISLPRRGGPPKKRGSEEDRPRACDVWLTSKCYTRLANSSLCSDPPFSDPTSWDSESPALGSDRGRVDPRPGIRGAARHFIASVAPMGRWSLADHSFGSATPWREPPSSPAVLRVSRTASSSSVAGVK